MLLHFDYPPQESFPNCSEKEYQKNLGGHLDWIAEKYGKDMANKFKEVEGKSRKMYLEKIAKSGKSGSASFWANFRYQIFKDSVLHRAVFYTMGQKNNQAR